LAKTKKVDYKKLLKGTTNQSRQRLARTTQGQALMAAMTPIELAELFPEYYRRSLPDMGKKPLNATTGGSGGGGTKGQSTEEIDEQFLPVGQGRGGSGKPGGGSKPGGGYSGSSNVPAASATPSGRRNVGGSASVAAEPQLTPEEKDVLARVRSGNLPSNDPKAKILEKLKPEELKAAGITKDDKGGYVPIPSKYASMSDEDLKKEMVASGATASKGGDAFGRGTQFKNEINNQELKERMMALALAENGTKDKAITSWQGTLETMFNRAQSTGSTLDALTQRKPAGKNYYAPFQDGNYEKAVAQLKANPELRQQLEDAYNKVVSGSNVSNFGTDEASGTVASSARRTQTVTTLLPSGQQLSRKDIDPDTHGAGRVKQDREWFKTYKEKFENLKDVDPNNITPEQLSKFRRDRESNTNKEQERTLARGLRGTESNINGQGQATATPTGGQKIENQNPQNLVAGGADELLIKSVSEGAKKAFGDPENKDTRFVVHFANAKREGDPRKSRHNVGKATDVQVYDRQENRYLGGGRNIFENFTDNPYSYRAAQALAQARYEWLKENNPEAARNASWGGHFPSAGGDVQGFYKGQAKADTMHHSFGEGGPSPTGLSGTHGTIGQAVNKNMQDLIIKQGGMPTRGMDDKRNIIIGADGKPKWVSEFSPEHPDYKNTFGNRENRNFGNIHGLNPNLNAPAPAVPLEQRGLGSYGRPTQDVMPPIDPKAGDSLQNRATAVQAQQDVKNKEAEAKVEAEAKAAQEKKDVTPAPPGLSDGAPTQLAQGGEIPYRDDEKLKASAMDNTSVKSDKTGREYQINPNRETVKANLNKQVLEVTPDYKLPKSERADRGGDKPQSADPARNAQPMPGNQGSFTQQKSPRNEMPDDWNKAHITVDPSSVSSQRAFRQALHFTDGPHHNYGGPFNIVA
jgi:hypothetical protein